MKNSKLIFAIVLFTSVFSSCELLDDESDDTGKQLEITNETISGKWMVSETNSGYESFEFTENGICIIVENTSTKSSNNENVKVGKYGFDDLGYGLMILLEGGGTYVLDDLLLTDKKASFSVTKNGVANSTVLVKTEKEEVIEDSENTKLLARSWKVVSTTFHGSEGDVVFDDNDITVVVDPKSLVYLDGTELDFGKEGLNEGFKFKNPNVKDECGCGESFNV